MKLNNNMCVSFLQASGWLANHDKEIIHDTVNAPDYMKRKCLIMNYEDFCNMVTEVFGAKSIVDYDGGYEISIYADDSLEWHYVLDKLSEHLNCKITTIHTVIGDETEFWICYR